MQNKKELVPKFGFLEATSMVVGIVIGSGIFFRASPILIASNGNVLTGVLGFLFIGIGVLFGALAVSNYAHDNDEEGGLVKYSEMVLGKKYSYYVGQFLVFGYFPVMVGLLAYYCSIFTVMFLNLDQSLTWPIAIGYFVFVFLTNYLSTKISGYLQIITTAVKLIPLLLVAFYGIFLSDSGQPADAQTIEALIASTNGSVGLFPLLISIAFAFDGWILATSISAEVKNAKVVLKQALVVGTILITAIYVLYFIGMSRLIGVEQIIQLGDGHVAMASEKIFGNSKVILMFVIVSIYGGLNGVTLASFRIPHALVSNGLMKNVLNIGKLNVKRQLSVAAVWLEVPLVLIYMGINYLSTIDGSFLNTLGVNVGDFPVLMTHALYLVLFFGVIPRIPKYNLSKINYLYVILASIVSLTIIIGSLSSIGLIYAGFSLFIMLLVTPLYNKESN